MERYRDQDISQNSQKDKICELCGEKIGEKLYFVYEVENDKKISDYYACESCALKLPIFSADEFRWVDSYYK